MMHIHEGGYLRSKHINGHFTDFYLKHCSVSHHLCRRL